MSNNITIIGGTGTLGKKICERFYYDNNVTIISRDEYKQQKMRRLFPNCNYIIGDIRDNDFGWKVWHRAHDTNYVFHCAALKHVEIGEKCVDEFLKTNVLGTINVARSFGSFSKIIFFSTDKAVLPINCYGFSKAISEKYLQAFFPNCAIYRWGNILGSRGSVISIFATFLKEGKPVEITDVRMTRFWLTIDEAVNYVANTYEKHQGIMLPPNLKSAKILDVVESIARCLSISEYKIKDIGIRPGEKIHECLYTTHDYCIRSDTCEMLSAEELDSKIRPILISLGFL